MLLSDRNRLLIRFTTTEPSKPVNDTDANVGFRLVWSDVEFDTAGRYIAKQKSSEISLFTLKILRVHSRQRVLLEDGTCKLITRFIIIVSIIE